MEGALTSEFMMPNDPKTVRTWLYTSQLTHKHDTDQIEGLMAGFQSRNQSAGLSGFLVTDGIYVMQLLEGEDDAVDAMKARIVTDTRHMNIVSEVWEMEAIRAYPNWSMRAVPATEYEKMFVEIESSKIVTIATNIARLLFDTTFDRPAGV